MTSMPVTICLIYYLLLGKTKMTFSSTRLQWWGQQSWSCDNTSTDGMMIRYKNTLEPQLN